MTEQASIYIIDDDPAIRDSLTLMLHQEGLTAKCFETAVDFLSVFQGECYGCAIIDIRMPGMDGIQLQEELVRRGYSIPIIFLTGHGSIPTSVKAIKAGAVDFLTKPVTRKVLLKCVQAALEESRKSIERATLSHDAQTRLTHLTEREREVMLLAVAGHPNKEIARRINISHRTVEIHKSHIFHKTGASNLLELARLVQECGIID